MATRGLLLRYHLLHPRRCLKLTSSSSPSSASSVPLPPPLEARDEHLLTGLADKLQVFNSERHIFLCADQSKPKCCSLEVGLESWEYLKKRCRELNLVGKKADRVILRTKTNCLQLCRNGPIALVYPEGTWYHSATPPVIERILVEHCLNGKVVEEFAIKDPNENLEGL